MKTTTQTFKIQDPRSGEIQNVNAGELKRLFDQEGVIVFPAFYDKELDAVNREMEQFFAPYQAEADAKSGVSEGASKHGCDVIPWNPLETNNEVFRALRDGEKLVETTSAVLGQGFTAPSSLVMFCVGGGRGQAWHQDCPAGEGEGYNLNRLIYTEDVDRQAGSIVFVPGSHRTGRIPPGGHQDPMPNEVVLEPRAGTLVFLHGHVFHRVTPNLYLKPRISVNFRAYPKGVDPDVNCIGVYRNEEVYFCDTPKHHDGSPADQEDS